MSGSIIHGDQDGRLCVTCQAIDLEQYLFQDLSAGTIELGGFQDILEKSTCPLCRLVIRALCVNSEDYWEKGRYPTEVCYFGQNDGLSQPSILEVWFESNSKTLPKGHYGHNTIRGEILLVCGDDGIAEHRPTNPGRLINSQIDLSLPRGWLSNCETQHGNKCGGSNLNASSTDAEYLLLIDVERHRVVECKFDCRYIALSYVWGKVPMLQTIKANLAELQDEGALTLFGDQIPRVVREAMEVVAGLGERYLWVDALCIVQDGTDKLDHIFRMHTIYGRAILTIIASAGDNASAGLPGIRPGSRITSQGYEIIHGLCLTNKMSDLFNLLQKSRWETRAWTFQERIFSRRCLYFTDAQSYFQCRSCICREDVLGEYSNSSLVASGAANPLEREVWSTESAYGPKFNIYEGLVKSYCGRKLSYQFDILNAFAGIMSQLHERFGWRFLSALPEEVLDLALLWKPMASCCQRFTSVNETPNGPSIPFPSWCWTAWIGDFYWDPWRTNTYAGNDIQVISEIETIKVKDVTGVQTIKARYGKGNASSHSGKFSPVARSLTEEETMMENVWLAKSVVSDPPVLYFWTQTVQLESLFLTSEKHHPKDESHPLSHPVAIPPSIKGGYTTLHFITVEHSPVLQLGRLIKLMRYQSTSFS